MRGLGTMLSPMLEQSGSQVAVLAFDSRVHPLESFTSDETAISRDLRNLQPGDGGAAILDAVNEAVKLLAAAPQSRRRFLLLVSETRDHGSQSAAIDTIIKAVSDSN